MARAASPVCAPVREVEIVKAGALAVGDRDVDSPATAIGVAKELLLVVAAATAVAIGAIADGG